jgi:hypothetical protein
VHLHAVEVKAIRGRRGGDSNGQDVSITVQADILGKIQRCVAPPVDPQEIPGRIELCDERIGFSPLLNVKEPNWLTPVKFPVT